MSDDAAAARLERSVAATLRVIDIARSERQAAPVRSARQRLGTVHGATRLARALEADTGRRTARAVRAIPGG